VSNPELETCIPEVCHLVCMMRLSLHLVSDFVVSVLLWSVVQSFCCFYLFLLMFIFMSNCICMYESIQHPISRHNQQLQSYC
jgi:hypothetical protein